MGSTGTGSKQVMGVHVIQISARFCALSRDGSSRHRARATDALASHLPALDGEHHSQENRKHKRAVEAGGGSVSERHQTDALPTRGWWAAHHGCGGVMDRSTQ